jgi:hypothetical protein
LAGFETWATSVHQFTWPLHWNGRTWKQVPSPNPGEVNELAGAAAVTASNIWAVGDSDSLVLIAHCC